ncbi:hypothetical protein DL766_004277 [Monosporascus sp. MC13-8B]|uniref:Ribosomal RNA-processing protein 1 n=1 Tax=Monosporascus cannonballus TaxID=155416 RepID=A0ABY0HBK8_9PEZI|nr:hypothetical protein DL762_003493 [Monosporascus cannonballus]RYO98579.1 hypothetical protein DL763_002109 [Monosporascus cannonballus]RYP31735.1 hypothetical protein DL766_004277 [Monosporascus sp. MC13-8B]
MATADEQNRKTRTQALSTLRTFLSSSSARPRTHLDNLKLWKGLFYSLWMCDRPVPQQNLCAELASLQSSLPPSPPGGEEQAVTQWLAAFWQTMAREWTGIDVLRLEKFLLLVRRVFGASVAWVRVAGAGEEGKQRRRDALLKLFAEWPLETSGDLSKVPVGLRLHVLDIWVDEVERAGFLGEGEEGDEDDLAFLRRMRELVQVQVKSPSKPVRARAKESLADERLPWNTSREDGDADESGDDEDGWAGFKD